MTKTPNFLTALVLALAAPGIASAQTYGGVSGGMSLQDSSKNKGTTTAEIPATPTNGSIPNGTPIGWDTKFDDGYNFSGYLGHRFSGGFRAEAEVNYSRNGVKRHRNLLVGGANIDGADVAILTRGTPAATNPTVGAVISSGIGKTRAFGGFLNGYYDFNSGGSLQPYVGAGFGVQRVKVDFRPSNVDVGQGSDTNLAYQFMAGATYKVGPSAEVFAQYNYRDAGKTKFALDLLPADLSVKTKQSILSLGVRVPFGGGAE